MENSTEQGKMCLQDTVTVIVLNNIVCYFRKIKWKRLSGIYFSLTISQIIITSPKFIL